MNESKLYLFLFLSDWQKLNFLVGRRMLVISLRVPRDTQGRPFGASREKRFAPSALRREMLFEAEHSQAGDRRDAQGLMQHESKVTESKQTFQISNTVLKH